MTLGQPTLLHLQFARRCFFRVVVLLLSVGGPTSLSAQTNAVAASTNLLERWSQERLFFSLPGFFLNDFQGTVFHRGALSANELSLKDTEKSIPLGRGDTLRTADTSRALVINTNIAVDVAGNSKVKVENPRQLHLLAGTMYFKSLGADTNENRWVQTDTVKVRLLGTEFVLKFNTNTGESELVLLDGKVQMSATNAAGERPLEAAAGKIEGISVDANGAFKPLVRLESFNDLIQWFLYYPAVVDPNELRWPPTGPPKFLTNSLAAYARGNVLAALDLYPPARAPESDVERIYRAALLLAVGQVDEVKKLLDALPAAVANAGVETSRGHRLAQSLRQVIAAVKFEKPHSTPDLQLSTSLATEWLAASYYQQ